MSEPLMLPLRPSSGKTNAADTLRAKIYQINEKGSFRNITEQSLLEEIHAKPSEEDVDMDAEEEDESDEDRDDRLENLYKGREEILRQLSVARNEAYSALDFISLLLTKYNSRQAENTMSPFLKENISKATIDTSKTKVSGLSTEEKARIERVSSGWKLESFSSSAERLLGASSRLQKEAARESKYWEQVSQIKADGWAVSRLPQEKHTLGVRFGFTEATPSFRNRGVATLRSDDDGSLFLDRGASQVHHRAVQVSIYRDDQQIGASYVPEDTSARSDAIEQEVLQARNSLFEEELFFEANREARSMANLGVVSGHNLITFDLPGEKKVRLRLLDLGEDATKPPESGSMNSTAEAIAISLRLLLSRAHRKNFERRTRPPPPMTNRPRQTPEYALLRPVMALLQHREYLDRVNVWLSGYMKPLLVAGLTLTSDSKALTNVGQMTAPAFSSDESKSKAWIESLIGMLDSTMEVQLPSSRRLDVKIRSLLGPPIWGTEFTLSEISWPSIRLPTSRYTSFSDFQNAVSQIIVQDVGTAIEEISGSRSQNEQITNHLKWKVEKPFSTDLVTVHGTSKSHMQFHLTPSAFLLRIFPTPGDTDSRRSQTYAWMKDGQVKKEVNGTRQSAEGVTLPQLLIQ